MIGTIAAHARNAFNMVFLVLITVAKLMIVAMTVVIGIMVFMRYVMGMGIRWANELALVLQVWFTFIAMALGVRKDLHISLNIMPEKLSAALNWALARLHALLTMGVGIIMVIYGEQLVSSTMRSVLPAMG
ncbi:MAG: TRAP transporter small permease, partial [Spirochaetaceae bacterium]